MKNFLIKSIIAVEIICATIFGIQRGNVSTVPSSPSNQEPQHIGGVDNPNLWKLASGIITPVLSSWGLTVNGNTTVQNLTVNGTCTGCGGGGAAPDWNKQTNFGVLTLTPSTTIPVWVKAALYASSTLDVAATSTFYSGIFATGTVGVTPGSGPGTRFMWIPSKSALRWGTIDANEWDAANIGQDSTAYGQYSTASAADSSAMGYSTTASGVRCFAAGAGSTCKASDSTAIGQNNYIETTAPGGTAIGRANSIYGSAGVAVGYQNVSEGAGATAIGSGADAIGNYSVVVGLNSAYVPASKQSSLANTFVVLGGNSSFGSNTYNPAVVNISATTTAGAILDLNSIAGQTSDYLDITSSTTRLLKFNASGHFSASGVSPVLSSCGTSPTIRGTDNWGEVTVGTTATSCTITFNKPYTNSPACVVSFQSTLAAETYSITASALTVGATALGGTKINYNCQGIGD